MADEVTSALDAANAQRVERLLLQRENCTVIHIAHKISQDTARLYDRIAVLRDGEVAAFGRYEQLAEKMQEILG